MSWSIRLISVVVAIVLGLGTVVVAPATSSAAATDFVSTWSVTDADKTITLPLYDGGTYNFTVNWGDGSPVQTVTTWDDPDKTRTYSAASDYTVTISGTLTGWSFNGGGDRLKIRGISQWGTFNPGNRSGAFRGCENLNITATDAPDLTGVTTLKEMFNNATSLTTPNFSNWNTASVTEMDGMFRGATNFNGNITGWNTSNVLKMREMFNEARAFNQDIAFVAPNTWNTSSVREMDSMFRGARAFNGNISGWNTSNVTTMWRMFNDAVAFNQNIGAWNTGNVAGNGMEAMFQGATVFNQNISSWDTSKVTTMKEMFNNAGAFNGDIGTWNTAAVTNMEGMFRGARLFNQAISGWNTSNVTTMKEMFKEANAFNQPIAYLAPSTWNTGAVTDMEGMFNEATAFNQPIGSWNTAAVLTMKEMFRKASAFNQNIGTWTTGAVTNMEAMFEEAEDFNQPIGTWNTGAVTTMKNMFREAELFNQDIGTWDTARVTDMEQMFQWAEAFNRDISSWSTANVTTMREMFNEAGAFNQPIGSWNTGSVTNMEGMFRWADSFNQPIGNWNTGAVTTMREMLNNARAFDQSLASWDVTSLVGNQSEFATDSRISPMNVDQTFAGWASQGVSSGVSLDLGNPGSEGSLFYTQGAGSVAISSLTTKGWAISRGKLISTDFSMPDPVSATMNAGDSRTFDVRLFSDASNSYNYDSRSVLTATPALSGSTAGAVTYHSNGNYRFTYTASATGGPAQISDTITLTVNGQTILTRITITVNCTLANRCTPPQPPAPAPSNGGSSNNAPASVNLALNGNGGSVAVPSVSGAAGSSVMLPTVGQASRPGYVLTGWSTSADGSGTTHAPGARLNLTVSGTLFAQWAPVSGVLDPVVTPATTGVPAGGSVALLDGAPTTSSLAANAAGTGVDVTGPGWNLAVSGATSAGAAQSLQAGRIVLPAGGSVRASGSGYAPGTQVVLYLLDPAITLGTVTVGADGSFTVVLPVPLTVAAGRYVLQVNGMTTGSQVRSVSVPVTVRGAGVKQRVQRVSATIYFASGSSRLTTTSLRTLERLASRVPAGARDVTVQCIGFVQPTRNTSNDKSLSTQRAVNACEQLRADGVRGSQVVSGKGRAPQTDATARRVEITIAYRR